MEKTGSFFEVLRATISTEVTEQSEVTKQVKGTTQQGVMGIYLDPDELAKAQVVTVKTLP